MRRWMIEDMTLVGPVAGTQAVYVDAAAGGALSALAGCAERGGGSGRHRSSANRGDTDGSNPSLSATIKGCARIRPLNSGFLAYP
jgi:hypothetical protein